MPIFIGYDVDVDDDDDDEFEVEIHSLPDVFFWLGPPSSQDTTSSARLGSAQLKPNHGQYG
jgi:hypothetical protein